MQSLCGMKSANPTSRPQQAYAGKTKYRASLQILWDFLVGLWKDSEYCRKPSGIRRTLQSMPCKTRSRRNTCGVHTNRREFRGSHKTDRQI